MPKIVPIVFMLLIYTSKVVAGPSYSLPADLGSSPFNCTGSGPTYSCNDISISKESKVTLTEDVTLNIDGNLIIDKAFTVKANGFVFNLNVTGNVDIGKETEFTGNITADGNVNIDKEVKFVGNIVAGGNIDIGKEGEFTGDLTASGSLDLGKNTVVDGVCTPSHSQCSGVGSTIPPVVAEYQLDGQSWSGVVGEIIDSSGNGLHGQSISGATPLPAKVCNGASLNGSSAYIEVADNPLLDISDELTVTAWIRPNSIPGSDLMSIVSKDENYEFHINASGQINWWWGGGAKTLTTTGSSLTAGNWYHIAIVYSDASNSQSIYINGALRASDSNSGELTLNSDPFQIGGDQGFSGREFDGLIDEVRVYHAALSSSQVNTVMNETHVCPGGSQAVCTITQIAADEEEFRGISGSSDNNVIAVGHEDPASFYHYDGTSWTKHADTSDEKMHDVTVVNNNLAYAVAHNGRIMKFDGTNWTVSTSPSTEDLNGVWAESSSELWVVGKKDDLWRWDGSNWTDMSGASQANIDSGKDLQDVWADSSSLYTVEKDGDLYRYTRGTGTWDKFTACNATFDMEGKALWSDGAGNVYIAGEDKSAKEASIFLYNESSNSCSKLFSSSTQDKLEGIYGHNSLVYAVSKKGLVLDNSSGSWAESTQGSEDLKSVWVSNTGTAYYSGKKGYATICTGIISAIDHYSITHSGVGITCEAESITVTAHDSSDVAVSPASTTSITLTSSIANDGWSLRSGNGTFNVPNSYTFDGTETSVQFWLTKTSATAIPHMDIDVTDGAASDPDDAGLEDQVLEFRETALRFYADDNYNNIGVQIAGKPSNVVSGIQALTLRAIQTNSDTGACEARVSGTQTVRMAFECDNPTTCKSANGVSITDTTLAAVTPISDNSQASVINFSDVDLSFDANGKATWIMNYRDAGQIKLHASLALAASGNDPVDTLEGTSNVITSVPAGLCVSSPDANASCTSGNVSCSAFKKAGDGFNLAVKAVGWEVSEESDTDFCSGNTTTPNFQLSSINLGHSPVGPATTVTGSAGVVSLDMVAGDNGDHSISGQTISEVGVFTFTASPPTYFGETISASSSANIGRFYPHHFALSAGTITNRIALGGGSSFTYMDENFELSYTLMAQNLTNQKTQNYSTASGFALLNTAPELNYAAVDITIPTNLSGRLTSATPSINWLTGSLGITDRINISRNVVPDGPYSLMDIGMAPTDDDGVLLEVYDLDVDANSSDDHALVSTTAIRFGRMVLDNTFGSELVTLQMPMYAEYYNGTNFILNVDDNMTALTTANLILSNTLEAVQTDADIQVLTGQVSQAAIANTPLSLGIAALTFCPPGNPACTPTSGNAGFIDVQLDLSLLNYLRFDWDGDASHDDDPAARATFGIFNGDSKQIYYRQVFQ